MTDTMAQPAMNEVDYGTSNTATDSKHASLSTQQCPAFRVTGSNSHKGNLKLHTPNELRY